MLNVASAQLFSYLDFIKKISAQVGVTTPTPLCEDKLKNCDQFGKQSCENEYVPWAKVNCPRYCNLCRKYIKRMFL